MNTTNAIARLTDQPALDKIAQPLSTAVRTAYEAGGAVGQQVKDAMHGVWLGHPLHPVFTDVPLGAWTAQIAPPSRTKGHIWVVCSPCASLIRTLTEQTGMAVAPYRHRTAPPTLPKSMHLSGAYWQTSADRIRPIKSASYTVAP